MVCLRFILLVLLHSEQDSNLLQSLLNKANNINQLNCMPLLDCRPEGGGEWRSLLIYFTRCPAVFSNKFNLMVLCLSLRIYSLFNQFILEMAAEHCVQEIGKGLLNPRPLYILNVIIRQQLIA